MAHFFLIDHSLRDASGHHFDYSRCISKAASDAALQPIIGCHRRLATSGNREGIVDLQQTAQVRPVFRQSVYESPSDFAGLRSMRRESGLLANEPVDDPNRWRRVTQTFGQQMLLRRREKVANRFANDCERFFQPESCQFRDSDHIFLTTVSEIELQGLMRFLVRHPGTMAAHWHLQFHFGLFEGRSPEYDQQRNLLKSVQKTFLSSLARLSYHSIHFYATSETLAEQLNRLNVCHFDHLPYPVSTEFHTTDLQVVPGVIDNVQHQSMRVVSMVTDTKNSKSASHVSDRKHGRQNSHEFSVVRSSFDASVDPIEWEGHAEDSLRPLRMVCAGGMRREKGQATELQKLVNNIWSRWMSTGRLKLVLQRPVRKWPARQKIELTMPADATADTCFAENDVNQFSESVEYHSHPLKRNDYISLIRNADIGLFCYDGRTYFGRCAGVLNEMLACGKPVIVPAGSWLADQIQQPINDYIQLQRTRLPSLQKFTHRDVVCSSDNLPLPGGIFTFDNGRHPFYARADIKSANQIAVIKFEWLWPKSHGTYGQLKLIQRDDRDNETGCDVRSVGVSRDRLGAMAMFNLDPATTQLQLLLTNAFDHSTVSVRGFQIELLGCESDQPALDRCCGAVGVVAATPADLPACIDEIMLNYSHYRRTAMKYSQAWINRHQPKQTINRLLLEDVAGRWAA